MPARSASSSSPSSPTFLTAPRARIVAAARRHFFQLGFARCTMDCLAGELGMSKKTLYAHFPTKEALVVAVIEDKVADFRAGLQALVDAAGLDFPERARRIVGHVAGQMGEISPIFLRDLERQMPDLFARIEAIRREVLPRVWSRMLTEGFERGHVRDDVEVPFICELVLLSVEGLLRPANLDRFSLAPRQVIDRVLSILFAGILTPAGRKAYEKTVVH
jgi:AcrR family transcriptional regulator